MNEGICRLDPEMAAAISSIQAAGFEGWSSYSVAEARRVEDELFSSGSGPEMESVQSVAVDGPDGDLPLRAYRPVVDGDGERAADNRQPPSLPTIAFYHGGGFVLGTLDSADDVCRELAARTHSVVVSVDYRLAPEDPFPAAVEDATAALRWAAENAGEFGGDPDDVTVAGTSAGGCLAAAAATRSRRSDVAPSAQVLLYPMLDPDLSFPSVQDHADRPLLSRADLEWFWDLYLEDGDRTDPLAAPLNADPDGLPPAVVATAGHDPLRDEGRAYADHLRAADVAVEERRFPSLAHGFASLADRVDRADRALDEVATAIDRIRS